MKKYDGNDETLIIPNGVTDIGSGIFENCSSLKSVSIPNGVTNIGYNTFANCSSLESITIPPSVEIIDSNAFDECKNLKDVYIEDIVAWSNVLFTFVIPESRKMITIRNSPNKRSAYYQGFSVFDVLNYLRIKKVGVIIL